MANVVIPRWAFATFWTSYYVGMFQFASCLVSWHFEHEKQKDRDLKPLYNLNVQTLLQRPSCCFLGPKLASAQQEKRKHAVLPLS